MRLEQKLERRLFIFLSADVIGSTAFKQQNQSQAWWQYFAGFHDEFDAFVENEYSDAYQGVRVQRWKSLGDELVYYCQLSSYAEAFAHVNAFRNAVRSWTSTSSILALKATGWVAGTPVNNMLLGVESDFEIIGPSVDVGFRLTKYSTRRRFVVAADLALLLLEDNVPFRLHYDGCETFKGIEPVEYPIVWIDMSDNEGLLVDLEAQVNRTVTEAPNQFTLKTYLSKFLTEAGRPFMVPFIESDSRFTDRPDEYEKWFREAETFYERFNTNADLPPDEGDLAPLKRAMSKALGESLDNDGE